MRISRHGVVSVLLMILAGFVFTLGITWGLPSRQDDRYLLGEDYHGLYLERFTSQVPEVDAARGADVVAPAGNPNEIVHLNDTDEKRAQILCRYRLYSYQPDEMITFRALSLMKPGSLQFDPRLYQYGGLWIYPVGVLIKTCSFFGFASIVDRGTYIDNPELFGRFYVLARAYSAAWGVVGVCAVYRLMRRVVGAGTYVAGGAALCFILMPVIINAAHEAKPHLAGAVLILLAALAADYWVESGGLRRAIFAGALCGAAAGMVLWAATAIFVIAGMALIRRDRFLPRFTATLAAFAAMVAVYAITNPYVIFHSLYDPQTLSSNLGNTSAMYHVEWSFWTIFRAIGLMNVGAYWVVALGFAFTLIPPLWPGRRAIPLALAAAAMTAEFIATAAGKPGEYGRLAILPDIALVLLVMSAHHKRTKSSNQRGFLGRILIVFLWLSLPAFIYLSGFMSDSASLPLNSRRIAAKKLATILEDHAPTTRPVLGIYTDPAPYCLPPVDLTGWDIVRLPRDYDPTTGPRLADVIVNPIDPPLWHNIETHISWADKKFKIIKK